MATKEKQPPIPESRGTEPIRLDFRSVEQVVVVPEDEDRFVTSSREAAEACRQVQNQEAWKRDFEAFLVAVHEWCKAHVEVVSHAYLGVGDEGLKVFVVTVGNEYQPEFDDELTSLDLDLAKRFARCPADVLQLPAAPSESLTSFFAPESAIQIFGDGASDGHRKRTS